MSDERPHQRYYFGPPHRMGIVGNFRWGQVAITVTGLGGTLVAMYAFPASAGILATLVVLTVTAAALFIKPWGRTIDEWAPLVLRWALPGTTARQRHRSGAHLEGHESHVDGTIKVPIELPAGLRGVELLKTSWRDREIGVIKQRRPDTYIAVIAVKAGAFGLLGHEDREDRHSGWGEVLASLVRERSIIRRVQWIDRTAPADGAGLASWFQQERDRAVALTDSTVQSYIELIETAPAVSQEHEFLVALQIEPSRAPKQLRRLGTGDDGCCEMLIRELLSLAEQLRAASLEVVGALPPRALAHCIRTHFDPYSRKALRRRAAMDGETTSGTEIGNAWPLAIDSHWASTHTDSGHSATYWIAEFPKLGVMAGWMSPLFMRSAAVRTVSVVMEPVSPSRAIQQAEAAITADEGTEDLRQRHGFRSTSRRRLDRQAIARKEEELAHGHGEFKLSGYVTVWGRNEEELDLAKSTIEQAAQQARLELRLLYGMQDQAFTYTLPLGRGIK